MQLSGRGLKTTKGRASGGTKRVYTGIGHECTVMGRRRTVCVGVGSCGERGEDVEKGKCYILVQSTVLGHPQEGGHKNLFHCATSSSQ